MAAGSSTPITSTARAPGLYRAACLSDLEGIVAKYKWGAYWPDPGSSSWVKIKNPAYTQAVGRHEQFTRYRRFSLDPTTAIHSATGGD